MLVTAGSRSVALASFGSRSHWLRQLLPFHAALIHALDGEDKPRSTWPLKGTEDHLCKVESWTQAVDTARE
eukprot:4004819-Amphidinium_carterae.1